MAVGRRPSAKPNTPGVGSLVEPPAFTFDPALSAQRRAAKRGLADTLADIKTDLHFGRRDLRRGLTRIRTDTRRARQKIGIDYNRSRERLSNERADIERKAQRQREDFSTRLADISRQFGELAHRQAEAQNAAGVLDQGTSAAAAAARARNQAEAEAPIRVAQQRFEEDLATALSRLDVAGSQLDRDRSIALNQLRQDRDFNRRAARTEFGRNRFLLGRKKQRAIREGTFTDADLLEQMIYQARLNHPGAFANYKPPARRQQGPAIGQARVVRRRKR